VRERNREVKNQEEERREQPRGREKRAAKRERESHCRGWWRRRRCMVLMKEQGSWPWRPWSDLGEKAVRESEIREREKRKKMREGLAAEKREKIRDGVDTPFCYLYSNLTQTRVFTN
jgi:hypothetical protein